MDFIDIWEIDQSGLSRGHLLCIDRAFLLFMALRKD